MSSRVYLMRHGTAKHGAGQEDHHMFSTEDTRLAARGVLEARAARDALAKRAIDAVVASPAKRAQHTAEIIAESRALDVQTDPDVLEVAFGEYGATYETLLERIVAFPRRFEEEGDPTFPNGETYTEVVGRTTRGIDRARKLGDEVVVVAHGIANRLLLGHYLHLPPRHLLRIDQSHACINLIEFVADRPMVRLLNWTPEVPGPLPWG